MRERALHLHYGHKNALNRDLQIRKARVGENTRVSKAQNVTKVVAEREKTITTPWLYA